ncbi:hypothetical protein DITRI_Ditri06bG0109300 [Diplodiscus trichospermus]
MFTKQNAEKIARKIGRVVAVKDQNEKIGIGKGYLRIMVGIDVEKPLLTGFRLPRKENNRIWAAWAALKYETLSDFCYEYGCLEHTQMEKENMGVQFRPFLRAGGEIFRGNTSKFLGGKRLIKEKRSTGKGKGRKGMDKGEKIRRKSGMEANEYVEPEALSGGLALWLKDEVVCDFLEVSKNCIDTMIVCDKFRVTCRITWVYRAPVNENRREVWQKLKVKARNIMRP